MTYGAEELLVSICRCPQIELARDASDRGVAHPCAQIVLDQTDRAAGRFQVPEPWSGHIESAKLLLISSNPSRGEHDYYPTADTPDPALIDYFENRFGNGPKQVKDGMRAPLKQPDTKGRTHSRAGNYWSRSLGNVKWLFERQVTPGIDYAITEVVHCKSQSEIGVAAAAGRCTELWLEPVLRASRSRVLILVGKTATNAFARHFTTHKFPLGEVTEVRVGDISRLVVSVRHPNARQPTSWGRYMSPDTIAALHEAIRT